MRLNPQIIFFIFTNFLFILTGAMYHQSIDITSKDTYDRLLSKHYNKIAQLAKRQGTYSSQEYFSSKAKDPIGKKFFSIAC